MQRYAFLVYRQVFCKYFSLQSDRHPPAAARKRAARTKDDSVQRAANAPVAHCRPAFAACCFGAGVVLLVFALVAALVFLYQHRAEIGVGYLDKVLGAMLEGAPFEARDAVFGDEVVDVVARRADGGAGGQEGLDARYGAASGGAGHSDDALALAGHRGAAHKVDLAADTAVLAHTDALAGHLAHQVDLEARVDGYHPVLLRDDDGVVGVVDGIELHVVVAVDEVIQLAAAHNERRHGLALVEGLAAAVDDALLHQLHHAVAEHLAVDAQVVLVAQRLQHGVGDGTDAQLKGGAVGDQRGAVAPYGHLDLRRGVAVQLGQVVGAGYDVVDLRHVDHRVAIGEGHHLVGLDDDALGHADGRQGIVAADAQRAVAVVVGRRGLEDGDVARYLVAYHLGHVVEVGREEVALKVVHGLARVAAQEVAHVAEVAVAARVQQLVVAKGGHMEYQHVVIVLAVLGHSVGYDARHGGGVAHHHAVAVVDVFDCFVWCRYFFSVVVFPVHCVYCLL